MPDFYAHYDSICTRCGGAIVKGERFLKNGHRRWCKDCVARHDDSKSRAAQQKVLARYNVG